MGIGKREERIETREPISLYNKLLFFEDFLINLLQNALTDQL